jgi:hypothetical protein
MPREIVRLTLPMRVGALGLSLPRPSSAVWIPNGNPVCKDTLSQKEPTTASDEAGGVIITWCDGSNSTDDDIHVQRIDSLGNVPWTAGGVAICTSTGDQRYPVIVEDGSGGAIVAWNDLRGANDDTYAQRIDASGAIQWATSGVSLCTDPQGQANAVCVSDGLGGAIVTWEDLRNGPSNMDIYTQRVDPSGVAFWPANGVPVLTAGQHQYSLSSLGDGGGGAFLAWRDNRDSFNGDFYVTHVPSDGGVESEPVPIACITVVLAGAAIGSLGPGVLRKRRAH